MTLKGGTSQACAACKYQRRKCTSECPLAPYFPADKPTMFQNTHKLFGVKKILKILKHIDRIHQPHAMHSIIFESSMREMYPVHGCCGIISQLSNQLRQAEEEFHAVRAQLVFFRQQNQNQHEMPFQQNDQNTLLLFHQEDTNNNNGLTIVNNDNNNNYIDFKGIPTADSMWSQHANDDTDNLLDFQSQFIVSEELDVQQEPAAQEYDELRPFFDTIDDDGQSYIDLKVAGYGSSPESSLKETKRSIDHVADKELKNAAACFTLTSVN